MKDATESPFDGYAIKVHKPVGDMCRAGFKVPEIGDLSSGMKVAKDYQKKSGKELWPLLTWSILVPCAPKGCCNGDNCDCGENAGKEEGVEETAAVCDKKKCSCEGECEYATTIDPWNGKFVSNFVKLHKTAFEASKELGTEGIMIDTEFYRDHRNYSIEYIQKGLEKKGVVKTPKEIEIELKKIGNKVADALSEVYGNKKGTILWMFFADLGHKNPSAGTKHLKATDCVTEGIIERAKDRVKVIDGGEHLLRYIHPSLSVKVQKKNLKISLEESIAKRDVVKNYVKEKKLDKYFELGGTFGLYQDINKLGCSWGPKADQWCPGEKGKCDEAANAWKWAEDPKQWCKEVEVRTLEDHMPLLRRLFQEYQYVWVYGGDGIPPYREIGPSVKNADRDKFRSVIVKARSCGTNGCESDMGETIENCPADCAPRPPTNSCGDGKCEEQNGENCAACPQDCGYCSFSDPPPVSCGDGKCEADGNESCSSCREDCGECDTGKYQPFFSGKKESVPLASSEPIYIKSKEPVFKGNLPECARGKVRMFLNGKRVKITDIRKSGYWRGKLKIRKKGRYNLQFRFYDRAGSEVHVSKKYEVVKI